MECAPDAALAIYYGSCGMYGTWFFESEEDERGRYVRENQYSSANNAVKDTIMVSSPIVEELVVAAENNKDVNVGQTPISSNVDPKLSRTSYARAMIKLQADVELKDIIMVAMPKLVFGHVQEECPKKKGLDVVKNLKNPSQAPRGVSVGPKLGFKPVKQVYRPVSKKNNVNINVNKKKDAESRKSISTTPIVKKIDEIEKLTIDRKITLVDDEGKPLEKVYYSGDHNKTYKNDDYDYEPYDDNMYEV
nr:hypothetical protein [Tanacetum cinerariifolium]